MLVIPGPIIRTTASIQKRPRDTWSRQKAISPAIPSCWRNPNAFHRLETKATTEPLQALAQYINNTWISSTTWHPSCWSVFQQSVRTNNDTEGWHHGLNRRTQGKSQLPFYLLVELLFQEAKLTSLQIRLVSDKKLKRIQRKEYRNVQARLFEAWDKYQNGDISVERLLKTALHLAASQI